MSEEQIEVIKQYFNVYTEREYSSPYYDGDEKGKFCTHKEYDDFKIIIFDNGEVYQLNSDHEIQGIELVNMGDLFIRFQSFTGDDISNVKLDDDKD